MTITKTLFSLFLLFISFFRPDNSPENRSSFQEDFEIMKKALLETHPNLYRFTSQERFQQVLDSIEQQLSKQTTELEFFQMMSQIISLIREAHSFVDISKGLMNSVKDQKLFPFKIYAKEDSFLITHSRVPAYEKYIGAEIIAINGQSMKAILKRLEETTGTASAFNNEALKQKLSLFNNFAYAYYFFVNTSHQFEITYVDAQGAIQQAIVQGKKSESIPEDVLIYREEPRPPVKFEIDEEKSVAILKITSFAYWVVAWEKKQYLKFFEKCFASIHEKGIQNLIIDIRDNRGGAEVIGADLLTYFIDHPFELYKYVKAKTLDFSYTNQLPESSYLSLSQKNYLETDSGFYLQKNEILQVFQPKEKNYFSGQVFILSNGTSLSASNIFLAMVKSHKAGTIIGSESGGAFEDVDGHRRVRFILPHSQLVVSYPAWSLKVNAQGGNPRRGVVPDYPIVKTNQDILNQKDVDMEFVYGLIREKK